jgi:hypothetical protein
VSTTGIDVSNGCSFFEHSTPESNFVILDPISEEYSNTSKNSYMTQQILNSFRKAFNTLKNILAQYQNIKVSQIQDNLLDILLEKSPQESSQSPPR